MLIRKRLQLNSRLQSFFYLNLLYCLVVWIPYCLLDLDLFGVFE